MVLKMYKKDELERKKKCNLQYSKFPCLRSLAREHCTSAIGCINKSTIERIHFLRIYIIYLYVFLSVLPLITNCIFFHL